MKKWDRPVHYPHSIFNTMFATLAKKLRNKNDKNRWISVSLRSICSTEVVSGQPKLHKENFSQNVSPNKDKMQIEKEARFFIFSEVYDMKLILDFPP